LFRTAVTAWAASSSGGAGNIAAISKRMNENRHFGRLF
jgi:hypothetical protein